jgi:ubiquinone/menaquinone biosynthesis C-methylase UbiE
MLPKHNDLAAATRTWNRRDESLESINRRIHDGAALDQLDLRADNYVNEMMNRFRYACLRPGASILEIGSGTGYIMEAFDRYARSRDIVITRLTGLDIAEHMIEKAKNRLAGKTSFSFVHYDGIHVPIPDGSFDWIYSVAALQHVPKPYVYNLFFEIYRLLKDDGQAIIQLLGFKCLPEHERLVAWREEIRNQIYKSETHWHHFYSAEELEFVLPLSGFKHVDVRDGTGIWLLVRRTELSLPTDFDPQRYLELNPDVAAGEVDPALHWKKYGYREGRQIR